MERVRPRSITTSEHCTQRELIDLRDAKSNGMVAPRHWPMGAEGKVLFRAIDAVSEHVLA